MVSPVARISPKAQPFKGTGPLSSTLALPDLAFVGLEGTCAIRLVYTPDRAIVTPEAFITWLIRAQAEKFESWEACLDALRDGFYDTVLPIRLDVSLTIEHADGLQQTLQAQQTRPGIK